MLIAVVFGYIMSAVMAFCGIYALVDFFQGDLQSLGRAGYLHGIAVTSWPLVVAIALFTLVQVAVLLEKLLIYRSMAPAETKVQPKADHAPVRQSKTSLQAFTRSFFHIEPVSIPQPVHDEATPADMELDSITELAHRTDSERMKTGSTPSFSPTDAPAAEQPPAAQQEPDAPAQPSPPQDKRKTDALTFFHVD